MREVWFWRGLASIAVAGWAFAATGTAAPVRREAPPAEQVRSRPRPCPPGDPAAAPALAAPEAPGAVPPEVLDQARREVREELRSRHEAHAEERLGHALEAVAAFAEAHDLSAETEAALAEAFEAMHARMRALPPPPLLEDASPEERDTVRERARASFEALDTDLRELLGDALAAELRDTLGPPRPGFGPPPPR